MLQSCCCRCYYAAAALLHSRRRRNNAAAAIQFLLPPPRSCNPERLPHKATAHDSPSPLPLPSRCRRDDSILLPPRIRSVVLLSPRSLAAALLFSRRCCSSVAAAMLKFCRCCDLPLRLCINAAAAAMPLLPQCRCPAASLLLRPRCSNSAAAAILPPQLCHSYAAAAITLPAAMLQLCRRRNSAAAITPLRYTSAAGEILPFSARCEHAVDIPPDIHSVVLCHEELLFHREDTVRFR